MGMMTESFDVDVLGVPDRRVKGGLKGFKGVIEERGVESGRRRGRNFPG
ncbi:hypothetical protein [Kitasatospora cathayae]